MARAKGLCEDCRLDGRNVFATEVHHVQPVEWARTAAQMEVRMFDTANLVALCDACHRRRHADLNTRSRADQAARERDRMVRKFDQMLGECTPGGVFYNQGGGA